MTVYTEKTFVVSRCIIKNRDKFSKIDSLTISKVIFRRPTAMSFYKIQLLVVSWRCA